MIFFVFDITFVLGIFLVVALVSSVKLYDLCYFISHHMVQIVLIFMALALIVAIIGYFAQKSKINKRRFLRCAIPGVITSPGIILSVLGVIFNIIQAFEGGVFEGLLMIIPSILVGVLELIISFGLSIGATFGFTAMLDGEIKYDRAMWIIILETLVAFAAECIIFFGNFT